MAGLVFVGPAGCREGALDPTAMGDLVGMDIGWSTEPAMPAVRPGAPTAPVRLGPSLSGRWRG